MARNAYPFKENAFTLYYSSFCPNSQSVLRIFEASRIRVHSIELNPEHIPEWYRLVSPKLKIPVLRTPEGELMDAPNIITRYIAEKYAKSHLVSTDPAERARLDSFVNIFNCYIIPHIFGSLVAETKEDQEKEKCLLLAGIKEANDELVKQWQRPSGKNGPFWYGNKFSLAEIDTASFVSLIIAPAHWRRFTIPNNEEFAAYIRWMKAIYRHPIFIKFRKDDSAIVQDLKKYVA